MPWPFSKMLLNKIWQAYPLANAVAMFGDDILLLINNNQQSWVSDQDSYSSLGLQFGHPISNETSFFNSQLL